MDGVDARQRPLDTAGPVHPHRHLVVAGHEVVGALDGVGRAERHDVLHDADPDGLEHGRAGDVGEGERAQHLQHLGSEQRHAVGDGVHRPIVADRSGRRPPSDGATMGRFTMRTMGALTCSISSSGAATSSTAPAHRAAGPMSASRTGASSPIGEIDGDAERTIDATGKVVAPGFVDVHTHFDAQVFWDGALTPSPLHGVTTVLAGNCGFTIAPLTDDAADGDYLMRMLARVEGMPLESLREGVPWSWRTTAEYLDAARRHARRERRVHGRPLRHPPGRDGRRRPTSARPPPTSSRR